jgi:hypothetical protein
MGTSGTSQTAGHKTSKSTTHKKSTSHHKKQTTHHKNLTTSKASTKTQ